MPNHARLLVLPFEIQSILLWLALNWRASYFSWDVRLLGWGQNLLLGRRMSGGGVNSELGY